MGPNSDRMRPVSIRIAPGIRPYALVALAAAALAVDHVHAQAPCLRSARQVGGSPLSTCSLPVDLDGDGDLDLSLIHI